MVLGGSLWVKVDMRMVVRSAFASVVLSTVGLRWVAFSAMVMLTVLAFISRIVTTWLMCLGFP